MAYLCAGRLVPPHFWVLSFTWSWSQIQSLTSPVRTRRDLSQKSKTADRASNTELHGLISHQKTLLLGWRQGHSPPEHFYQAAHTSGPVPSQHGMPRPCHSTTHQAGMVHHSPKAPAVHHQVRKCWARPLWHQM